MPVKHITLCCIKSKNMALQYVYQNLVDLVKWTCNQNHQSFVILPKHTKKKGAIKRLCVLGCYNSYSFVLPHETKFHNEPNNRDYCKENRLADTLTHKQDKGFLYTFSLLFLSPKNKSSKPIFFALLSCRPQQETNFVNNQFPERWYVCMCPHKRFLQTQNEREGAISGKSFVS